MLGPSLSMKKKLEYPPPPWGFNPFDPDVLKYEQSVNVLKFDHFSLSILKYKSVCIRAEINKTLFQNNKQGRLLQTASGSLIWVCAVCLGLFGMQLVFET